ncbi:MAG: sigma-54-dependent Fis family transcriptional regulator [Hyphomicrobiaceae bacterium]|nr:sigma-54-dependent Fis family transcriptional regulator [Hyphomicrobiaceae bacterium]
MNIDRKKKSLLVVEDDAVLRQLISRQLEDLGYRVMSAKCWRDVQAALTSFEPDLVILDMRLPDANGLDVMDEIASEHPVIVLTAYASIQNAVQAVRKGAVGYLSKPVNLDELELEVARAIENAAIKRDYEFVRGRERATRQSLLVGDSPALRELEGLIGAVAQSPATVLLEGESGVGKELAAREIHERSPRAERNYVVLDCCTLQENLFESELFGHEKGSFTGAVAQKRGLIEAADGGTLFLDEIGEISPSAQAKLLRLIETRSFRRVGGTKDLTSDARIVAATNRDLAQMAREGRFRADLYYRLSAFVIRLPPLRERRNDIPILARHFLEKHDFSRRIRKDLSRTAERTLVAYDWPGNVRELRNVMERAIILSGGDSTIHQRHFGLPADAGGASSDIKLNFDHVPTMEEVRRTYVEMLHAKLSGHRANLAAALGISERNLYRLLQRYGLE